MKSGGNNSFNYVSIEWPNWRFGAV